MHKDKLKEVERNFPNNKKYVVNDTKKYVTVLVGEEVDIMNNKEDIDIFDKL